MRNIWTQMCFPHYGIFSQHYRTVLTEVAGGTGFASGCLRRINTCAIGASWVICLYSMLYCTAACFVNMAAVGCILEGCSLFAVLSVFSYKHTLRSGVIRLCCSAICFLAV